jgi:hypothetical protein
VPAGEKETLRRDKAEAMQLLIVRAHPDVVSVLDSFEDSRFIGFRPIPAHAAVIELVSHDGFQCAAARMATATANGAPSM